MSNKAFIFGYNTFGLKFADNDIDLMVRAFKTHNYEVITPPKLKSSKGRKNKLTSLLDTFCDTCSASDTVVFYFSGHAFAPKGNLLLLLDSDLENQNRSSLRLSILTAAIEECRAQNKLLILDCCHALSELSSWKPTQSESVKLLAASGRLEQAKEIDALGSSFLAYHIYKGMTEDYFNISNGKNTLTINSLYVWLTNQTTDFNNNSDFKVPTPKLLGDQGQDFSICTPARHPFSATFRIYLNRITKCFSGCARQCFGRYPWCRPALESLIAKNQYVVPRIRFSKHGEELSEEKIDKFISSWLLEDNFPQLALLGDSGAGKSSSCIFIFNDLSIKCLESPEDTPIPIFLSLDVLAKKMLLGKDIATILKTNLDIHASDNEIDSLVRNKRFIFILDGFDEISDRADHGRILKNLQELKPILNSGCKIILTSRTHYFANQEQIDQILLGNIFAGTDLHAMLYQNYPHFLIAELQEFSIPESKALIEKVLPGQSEIIWSKISGIYNLQDLSRKPILLHLILQTLPDLIKCKREISRADLYEAYSIYWLRREAERNPGEIDINRKNIFIGHLALQMWRNDTISIHFEELEEEIREQYFDSIKSDADLYRWDYDTRNSSFLNRDSDGYYRFMHKSFMEFFLAKKCVKEIAMGTSALESWSIKWFDKEVANFIADLVQSTKYSNTIKRLIESSIKESNKVVLWNILHILSLIDISFFAKNAGSETLSILRRQSEKEPSAVILRQYCRIIAKFENENTALKLIRRLIHIVQNDIEENYDNNNTYHNYYYGQKSACEALLTHLSSVQPKYDRELHIYVLGEIGDISHVERLRELSMNWSDTTHLKLATMAIDKMKYRNEAEGSTVHSPLS